jgi:hypothetical protein
MTDALQQCAQCGTSNVKMSSCARCLSVHYCGRTCQKSDWKQHKKICNKEIPTRVAGLGQISLPASPNRVFRPKYGYRLVRILPVANRHIIGCCALCSMSMLYEGDYKRYWIPDPFPHGESYPCEYLLHRWSYDGEKGYIRGIEDPTHWYISVCLFCARVMVDGPPELREPHLKTCFALMSRDSKRPSIPEEMRGLSMMEKRLIGLIDLSASPDLSEGKNSIAGKFKDSTKKKVPFSFLGLESTAFPCEFDDPLETWDEDSTFTAQHYVAARLCSVVSVFRDDPDYIVFLLHRAAAYDSVTFAQAVRCLPPVSSTIMEAERSMICIPPFEDVNLAR